jgi:hypothetical protein
MATEQEAWNILYSLVKKKKRKETGCNKNFFFGGSDMPSVERYEHNGGLNGACFSGLCRLYTH